MQMQMLQIMQLEREEFKPKKEIELTDRDFGIIELTNEMKFASLQDLYEKFFSITWDGSKSISDEWARKRVYQLESNGLLKKTKSFSESTTYYQATRKGRLALTNRYPGKMFSNYYTGLDLNTFAHDKLVLKSRLYLEKIGVAGSWQSDRNLRQEPAVTAHGLRTYVPDGLYTTESGRRVAFEIEVAQKGRNKYQEKIEKFLTHIEQGNEETRIFDVVHFVCERDRVFEILKAETDHYRNHFKVTKSADFFSGDVIP